MCIHVCQGLTNYTADEGGRALAEMLTQNQTLKKMLLSSNLLGVLLTVQSLLCAVVMVCVFFCRGQWHSAAGYSSTSEHRTGDVADCR